ncbi:magnesium transporter MRS2-1-like isoform X2 [Magnolia sinica]|uniref:magnesium transporter MRS2-1-like isoform X2 n=1 Tax=Magnolia sinica TaxID=86752 RepID=UPI00265A658A|nr:magnesium transporter MRS2-1-like isoform X2 [Magnolia sinica]
MSFPVDARLDASVRPPFQGFGFTNLKKRGHGSRSWIQIDRNGNSHILALDKATLMRRCNLPARDLRLLDPLFVYPSAILGREKAIVVNLEQIRCIIMADEVILMNSLDSYVVQYESELCRRLRTQKDQSGFNNSSSDDLAFEFRALELALELTCMSLDAQVTELEIQVYPVLDELALSISTLNLERARKQKSHLLALTRRVQKVRDEIEQLMNDDGDMAEMYLTEKKGRMEAYPSAVPYFLTNIPAGPAVSKSATVAPVSYIGRSHKLDKTMSSDTGSSKCGSSSNGGDRIEELEMLLEAYFVAIDNTFSKLLSLKEYIDNTEDFINIKLDNVQNQLIQFELLLTAATFVATVFAVASGVFGMNFTPLFFKYPDNFNSVLIVTSISCVVIYASFILYFKYKRLLPL